MKNITKLLSKKTFVAYVLTFIFLIAGGAHAEFLKMKEVEFWKYERGFFLKSWKQRRFDGATYNGQSVPINQISSDVVRERIGVWCRVYLVDISPVSLFYENDGQKIIYDHDNEDYLKFKC